MSSDFNMTDADLSQLEIRPTATAFHYFFHLGENRLIKDFVLGSTARVDTLCKVSLVRSEGGTFSPRLRFWKRDKVTDKTLQGKIKTTDETRLMRASVDTSSCNQNLWRLIDYLRTFPEIQLPKGSFVVASGADADFLKILRSGNLAPETMQELAESLSSSPDAVDLLSKSDAGALLATAVQHKRHLDVVEKLRQTVESPGSNEDDVQKILQDEWWLFGGRFVGTSDRRRLNVLDELDIPLLRADGTLHVIELKTPVVKDLVVPHRGDFVVGPEVNKAMGQVANYLRNLDEERNRILTQLGVDCRRAFATVVIGHTNHAATDAKSITEAFRTYGSHFSRIDLITYDELVSGATQSLSLSTTN